MAFSPKPNPAALIQVKNSTTGTIPSGRGGVFTGAIDSTDGSVLVAAPSGADAVIHCVSGQHTFSDTVPGDALLVGMSMVQLKAGSAIDFGDKVNIKSAAGDWQTAPALSQNVYYIAMETVASGAMFWAIPVGSRPL